MYVVIFCSFLAILLTYLDSKKMVKGGMKWGFILVTLLAVIHYDYGNDYMPYYNLYQSISSYEDLGALINTEYYRDAGWTVVNYLFRYLGGFFGLVAVISVFQGVTYYRAIRRYLTPELWVLGVIVYLLVPSFYLYNFSMLRQGFVIAVFLAVWPLIEKRKWWIVAPLLYLSSFIHGSALILIPFAFWGFFPVKNGKTLTVVLFGVLAAMYFSSDLLINISDLFFTSTDAFDSYLDTYSSNSTTRSFGIGFFVYLVPTIVQISYLGVHKTSDNTKRLVALSCLSYFIIPLSMVIPMVGRIAMYFNAYSVMAIPIAYNEIREKTLKYALIALYVAILLYDYYIFFTSEVWAPSYSTFHTIFSV